jgi:hypothetical protein
MATQSNVSSSSFARSSLKALPEPLELLLEAFREHSSTVRPFVNGIYVSRPVEGQLEIRNFHGDETPGK